MPRKDRPIDLRPGKAGPADHRLAGSQVNGQTIVTPRCRSSGGTCGKGFPSTRELPRKPPAALPTTATGHWSWKTSAGLPLQRRHRQGGSPLLSLDRDQDGPVCRSAPAGLHRAPRVGDAGSVSCRGILPGKSRTASPHHPGLEHARITAFGYAIEYDALSEAAPTTWRSRAWRALFKARNQRHLGIRKLPSGAHHGINAAAGEEPLILGRE